MIDADWSSHVRWLNQETHRLLDFGRASAASTHGFAWLDASGRPDPARPLDLWVTARMTHVYALGVLIGYPGAEGLVDHGLAAMAGPFADRVCGGWYSALNGDGSPADATKAAYAHAFVVLASTSAAAAGRPGADDLLRRALASQNAHFWEPGEGMVVDSFDRTFSHAEPYRGVNANMHTVEAYLAAADVTGDSRWRRRALSIVERVVTAARGADWRIPEHYTVDWRPLLDYNADDPNHQFRPYGATPGHGFEWSRLILGLRAALGAGAPDWLKPAAESLFRRAQQDGWQDRPTPGFVYTTDWDGRPVNHARLHWVAAEAVAAAITAYRVTGDPLYHHLYDRWWDVIDQRFIDRGRGSWRHELDPEGHLATSVWDGKPDIYHAAQATLIPRLPPRPTLASALRAGLLDSV
ncbi:MAG: AGE family epimerase/isomerase [Bifidobacteriaceae bacterium]|jgi:mannose/cellobiose epimerase-like protein (N-acyl-D-glucosamine 2-epimerase family)|nr:AGE family epimerase/isomerase [Bifidobacteriaceae bacterium]